MRPLERFGWEESSKEDGATGENLAVDIRNFTISTTEDLARLSDRDGPPQLELQNRMALIGDSLLSLHVLRLIRLVIRKIMLPTWLTQPPANRGEASHGKLKVSTWRHLHLSVPSFALLQIARKAWCRVKLRALKQITPSTVITPMLRSSFHIAHQMENLSPAANLST